MDRAVLLAGYSCPDGMLFAVRKRFPGRTAVFAKTLSEGLRAIGAVPVFVQPLLLLPGLAYEKLLAEAVPYRESVTVGLPLLHDGDSVRELADILAAHCAASPAVFAGHGTAHSAARLYADLREALAERGLRAFVALLDGKPGVEDVLTWAAENKICRAALVPLMMGTGRHVQREIFGEGADSLRKRIMYADIEVDAVRRGLLDDPSVREVFLRRIGALRNCSR